MVAFNQYILILATATIFLTASAHAGGGDLCSRASYPALCRKIVKPKMSASDATIAAIKSLIRETSSAQSRIMKRITRLQANETEASLKASLSACWDLYGTTISNLQTGITYVKKGDKGGVDKILEFANIAYLTCDYDLAEAKKNAWKVLVRLQQLAYTASGLLDEMHLP